MPAERSRYLGNQNSKHEELGISRFEKKTFKRKIGQFWTLPKSEENLKALGILTAHKPSSAKRKLACIAIASRFQRCALHLWDAPTDLDLDHAGLGPWPWCQTWLCAKAQRRCFMTRNGPDMQNQSIPSTYIYMSKYCCCYHNVYPCTQSTALNSQLWKEAQILCSFQPEWKNSLKSTFPTKVVAWEYASVPEYVSVQSPLTLRQR